ncbi:MAG: hypothetical protein ACO1SX_04455 [Actinomycetota bacterium]
MRKLILPLLALIAAYSAASPVHAAKGTVAVLPATVVNGAAGNGPAVTQAIRESLRSKGYTVLDRQTVDRAISRANVDTSRIQTLATLTKVRKRAGADYVVYPRVLSVGQGVNTQQYQANIIVNVMGSWAKGFAHTRQVGQVFKADVPRPDRAVIGKPAAETAVSKLMQGFYAKR